MARAGMVSGKYICIRDFGFYKVGCIYRDLPTCPQENWFPLEPEFVTEKTPLTPKEIQEHFIEVVDSQRPNKN